MSENWVGKSVSIQCRGDIGVFQGIIKQVNPAEIVIRKAVRNGIPLKKTTVEVTLTCKDIVRLELIASSNVPNLLPVKGQQQQSQQQQHQVQQQQPQQQHQVQQQQQQQDHCQLEASVVSGLDSLKLGKTNGSIGRAKSPPNESRTYNGKLASKSPGPSKYTNGQQKNGLESGSAKSTSRPIEINGGTSSQKGNSFAPYKNDNQKKKARNGTGNGNGNTNRVANKHSTFGTPVDDPMMDEEFDFEKNLALFDKQAIWDEIDAIQQRPDLLRQTGSSANKKYRHDENVLASEPIQYRQIELENLVVETSIANGGTSQEYVTDEGLVIPSIPLRTRNLIQQLAENHGLVRERQNDLLARGATDIALQLLGGSRRLTPNNQHQWPKIVIVCDEPYNARLSEIGITTGRLLACHGLKVVVYVSCATKSTRPSHELELYAATGNLFTLNVNALPSSDLVIAAIKSQRPAEPLRKWLAESRAPVLVIDPPAGGLEAVSAKCSILPILPLNDLGSESVTGRLYLCSLGIPDKFFTDAGIKYKSPFDKAVIPIHRRKD